MDRPVLEELPVCIEHEKMLDVMESEVVAAIKSLRKGKAPGAEEMIQAGGRCSLEMLHGLYIKKECPEDWDRTIIVPIHKKENGMWQLSSYKFIKCCREGILYTPKYYNNV